MRYCRDYAMLLRTGRHYPKEQFRAEYSAGLIVGACLFLGLGLILLALIK